MYMASISKAFPVAGMPGMNPPWSVPGRWLRSQPGRRPRPCRGSRLSYRARPQRKYGRSRWRPSCQAWSPGNTWCSTKSSASQSAAYWRSSLSNTAAANVLTGRWLVSEHLAQHDRDHYGGGRPEAVQPAGGGVDRDRPDDPGDHDHLHQSGRCARVPAPGPITRRPGRKTDRQGGDPASKTFTAAGQLPVVGSGKRLPWWALAKRGKNWPLIPVALGAGDPT